MTDRFAFPQYERDEGGRLTLIFYPTNKATIRRYHTVENWQMGLGMLATLCIAVFVVAYITGSVEMIDFDLAWHIGSNSLTTGLILIGVIILLGRYRMRLKPLYEVARRAE